MNFGEDTVERFLRENKAEFVVRSHQLVMNGYQEVFPKKLFTVWSAPNYTYRCDNLAAVMNIDDHLNYDFTVYKKSPEQAVEDKGEGKVVPPHFT